MKINQSFIKRISKNYCPKKVKAELEGKHKRKTSDAMIKGQYFEYLLFKTKNREGQIPVMPLLKNGNKSLDQIRIEAQAENFFKVCDEHQIKFFGTDRTFHTELFGFETFGTWDGYGLYKRKPVIIDIKLPGNISNTFGDFCWGDIDSMDKVQADQYMVAGRKLDDVPYDFLYMVFDYKKKPEYVLHHVKYTNDTPLRLQERLEDVQAKISLHEVDGWPEMGFPDECKDCCFSDTCASFVSKEGNKNKWKEREQKKITKEEDVVKAQEEIDALISGVFDEKDFTF
jgi:hypothetical protein